MSFGQIVGGVDGAVIGFWLGGPTGAMMGAALGAGIGGVIDPLEPDLPSPGQPELGDLDVTTATEGLVISDFVGTTKMAGNIFWYGKGRTKEIKEKVKTGKGGGGSKKVTKGFEYYLSWAVGLAIGPVDEVYTILKNDDVVWSGSLKRSDAVDGSTTVTLDGMGSMTLYFGGTDHAVNSVLSTELGAANNTPFKGLCWAFFDDCLLGQYNRAPTVRFVMRKTPEFSFSMNNVISTYDYNPAHAIWYILGTLCELNESWMSTTAFSDFAADLFDENRGVSVLFTHQEAMQYINAILKHVNGVMPYGDETGKFEPKLLRDDVATSAMTSLRDDDFLQPPKVVTNSYMDTINDVKVQYSQIYEIEQTEVTGDESSIINPDDDFSTSSNGDPDTTKWLQGNIAARTNTDGTNFPQVSGGALKWSGAKTAEGSGEETYRCRSIYHLPKGPVSHEIQATFDFTQFELTNYNFGDYVYAAQFGLGESSNFDLSDYHCAQFRKYGNGEYRLHFQSDAVYTSGITLTEAHFPCKVRVRVERSNGATLVRYGFSFYNNVTGQWEDDNGNPDSYWYSTSYSQTAYDVYVIMDFNTQSGGFNSNQIACSFDDFKFNEGVISCYDYNAVYGDGFGTTGATLNSGKWDVINSGNGITMQATPWFSTLNMDVNPVGGKPLAVIRSKLVMPENMAFICRTYTQNSGNPGSGYNHWQGIRVVDSVTGNMWSCNFNLPGISGSRTQFRQYTPATGWVTLQQVGKQSGTFGYEIERYGSGGSMRGRVDNLLYTESTLQTTNPCYVELFSEISENSPRTTKPTYYDYFQVEFLEGGPGCAVTLETTAIDIRQATVHAEDPGNKEVLGRIRHNDVRMMLYTNDDNARWAAANAIRMGSIPLRTLEAPVSRRAARFRPGDVFKVNSSKYGITDAVFRLLQYKEGNIANEDIILNAIEDANYIASLVVVDEADRDGSRYNPYLTDVIAPAITETPFAFVGENMYLIPLVGRDTGNETGYIMYISADDESYSELATFTSFVTAGTLKESLPISEPVLDNTNKMVVQFNYDQDAQDIETISRATMISGGNLGLLKSGTQEEIIGFETITPVTGITGRYELTGLYRGRYDTKQYVWPADTTFYFLGTTPPIVLAEDLFKGDTRYFKYIYVNDTKVGDLSTADSTTLNVLGRAWTPYIPGNFRCNNLTENSVGGAVYSTAMSLTWSPRVRGEGAGLQNPDVVVDAAPTWEGLFDVQYTIGATTGYAGTNIDAVSIGFTEGQIKSWNGGVLPDSVTLTLTNHITTAGVKYTSGENTLTVTKE